MVRQVPDSFQKAQQAIHQAVRSGAAPKSSSRKAEPRASEEDIDGQPVLEAAASRQPSGTASIPALDIVGYDIDGEKLSERRPRLPALEVAGDSDIEREFGKASDRAPRAQPSPSEEQSDSDEQMHGDADRSLSPESSRPNKEAKSNPRLQTEANDQERQERRQERETFQERLRRKQMERTNAPEVPKKDLKVAPDKSALQVAALAIKAVAATGSAVSAAAEQDERQEESPEAKRPLTRSERTRVCAERAAALGLTCDFSNGRLLPAERARVLIDAGRRRRRGEHVDKKDLPPLPSEAPPPPPKAEPDPVDQEVVIRAAEAAGAAQDFASFLAARSRAVAAPVQLAPVSDQLQQRIQIAAITRAKKQKRQRRGRDFDYDLNVDGESMESSEEQRCMDGLDGSPMDSDDEKEALLATLDGHNGEKKHLGRSKLLCGHGGLDDVFM